MISEQKLIELYKNKSLTAFEIAEIYQVDKEDIINLLKVYEIDLNPSDRKFRLIRKVPFSNEQKSFIVGLLLGNKAQIVQYKDKYHLEISEEVKDRLFWKKSILGNFVNKVEQNGFKTCQHQELRFFWKMFYNNNKKVIKEDLFDLITNFCLFVWFLDSSRNRDNTIRLDTSKFSKIENEILQRILKVNFDIRSKVCEYEKNNIKYYFLSINKRNSEILMKIINPYLKSILNDYTPNPEKSGVI